MRKNLTHVGHYMIPEVCVVFLTLDDISCPGTRKRSHTFAGRQFTHKGKAIFSPDPQHSSILEAIALRLEAIASRPNAFRTSWQKTTDAISLAKMPPVWPCPAGPGPCPRQHLIAWSTHTAKGTTFQNILSLSLYIYCYTLTTKNLYTA